MNYVGKGILLNFLEKGNLNISSPMSAKVASPTDLGSTSRWQFLDCFILSSKIYYWTWWLILYALVLSVASCFHTSFPVVFSSPIAGLIKCKSELFSKVASGFPSHNKIWHTDLWGPTWLPALAVLPSPLCSVLAGLLAVPQTILHIPTEDLACSSQLSAWLFLASWCLFKCCPIQKVVLTLLSIVSFTPSLPSIIRCPLALFLLSTYRHMTYMFICIFFK